MLKLYSNMIHSFPDGVEESNRKDHELTERHLQILWLEQKSLHPLWTKEGEVIEVISPGIWNREAGPDFLRAHLRIGQREYRGDIEIHLHESQWYQHGHHCDINYNQVILHVFYTHSFSPLFIHKENGQQVYSCDLNESLKITPKELVAAINFDFYPGQIYSTQGRCAEHVFKVAPDAQINLSFQFAAYWRLEKKLNFLQYISPLRSLQFASGVAMALGYKHNAKAFLELFLYLLNYRDLPYEELLAIALGCCGFLEEGRKESWEKSPYYQNLRLLWWGRKDQMTHQANLRLDRIRPVHHPVRRLAYLVLFLQDSNFEVFWDWNMNLWEKALEESIMPVRRLEENLLNCLPIYQEDYWNFHYTFESCRQKKSLSLLGNEIKQQILLNTTLPLLYGAMKESPVFQKWEKFHQFYLSLEVPQTSKSRYLNQRFFGNQKDGQFFNQAQMVQGAYQLHQDFCMHYEASCKGCPFVERYQSIN